MRTLTMWGREDHRAPVGRFWTPPPTWNTEKRDNAAMPKSERKAKSSMEKQDPFHEATSLDSPYVRAKHAQLICKDPNRAISLFWAAINAGDRVDSALKDMAIVMKQLNRFDEGIEAIKSFRYLCSFKSQDSIDNLLLELYKKSGRIQEEAELLEHKLKALEQDMPFGQGKQGTVTIKQEKARILGNLAWVHLQLHNYGIAEQYYRNALAMEPDKNKQCNLAICLTRMDRIPEAKSLLDDVRQSLGNQGKDDPLFKSYEHATEILAERESRNEHGKKRTGKLEDFVLSSSSDNFSSTCSIANDMEGNQAVAGTGAEQGNLHKSLGISPESVGQKSPDLSTQPRECRRVDEEVNQIKCGATQRIRFGKTFEAKHHQNLKRVLITQPWECKRIDQEVNQIKWKEMSGAGTKIRFGKPFEAEHHQNLKRVKSTGSMTSKEPLHEKKLDLGLMDEFHRYIYGNPAFMTNETKKRCLDTVEAQKYEKKGSKSSASDSIRRSESSAFAQIILDVG